MEYRKINEHLKNAKEKHPSFPSTLFLGSHADVMHRLESARQLADRHFVGEYVLEEEILEIKEAYLYGSYKHALEECYDAIAVLLRMAESLEDTIKRSKE